MYSECERANQYDWLTLSVFVDESDSDTSVSFGVLCMIS